MWAHFDWLLKPRISFTIHLRATCARYAGINELKSSLLRYDVIVLVYILRELFTSMSVASGRYLLSRTRLGKYPPPATSANSC